MRLDSAINNRIFIFSNDLSVFDVGEVVSCMENDIYRKNNRKNNKFFSFFLENSLKYPYIMI